MGVVSSRADRSSTCTAMVFISALNLDDVNIVGKM